LTFDLLKSFLPCGYFLLQRGLSRFEELLNNLNDIVESRIEKNLKMLSKITLTDLPTDRSFSLDQFVSLQEAHVLEKSEILKMKNIEIETSVEDLLRLVLLLLLWLFLL
jgi:dynein heavy chain